MTVVSNPFVTVVSLPTVAISLDMKLRDVVTKVQSPVLCTQCNASFLQGKQRTQEVANVM